MTSLLFYIQDVGMAGFANSVARIRNRPGRNLIQRIAPVMPELTETLGNEEAAQYKEKRHSDRESRGNPEQVRYVFESHCWAVGRSVPIESAVLRRCHIKAAHLDSKAARLNVLMSSITFLDLSLCV